MSIVLPWPSSELSGHQSGRWRQKAPIVRKHREWACAATYAACGGMREVRARYAGGHDIAVHVRFIPPDNRSDRANFPNRMKPYFDGIADALGVNDSRFLPSYEFCTPEKPGRVEVVI